MGARTGDDGYAMGRTAAEERRLQRQAALYRPFSRRLFEAAGIGPGMTVLDLGSGAGDVAMLAAELVGPTGRVVGVDVNPAILDTARRRADAAGYANVTFLAGDIGDVALEDGFDAVVGRLVLMYLRDPTSALRRLRAHLKPGGVAAFTETDFTAGGTADPPSRLHEQLHEWCTRALASGGADVAMGMKLHRVFVDAGFAPPRMIVDAMAGGGPAFVDEWSAFAVDTIRVLLPLLVKGGIASEAEIGIDTLAERYRDDLLRHDRAIRSYPQMGAWAPRP